MNEQIRQLADQCFVVDTQGNISANAYMIERFAELIVQDCLAVIEKRMNLGTDERCRQECKALIAEIQQQYGVK